MDFTWPFLVAALSTKATAAVAGGAILHDRSRAADKSAAVWTQNKEKNKYQSFLTTCQSADDDHIWLFKLSLSQGGWRETLPLVRAEDQKSLMSNMGINKTQTRWRHVGAETEVVAAVELISCGLCFF